MRAQLPRAVALKIARASPQAKVALLQEPALAELRMPHRQAAISPRVPLRIKAATRTPIPIRTKMAAAGHKAVTTATAAGKMALPGVDRMTVLLRRSAVKIPEIHLPHKRRAPQRQRAEVCKSSKMR